MQRKLSLLCLYGASILMILGGIGDQLIRSFLKSHLDYLGNPSGGELLDRSESLAMNLLHATGGGLMGTGIACLAIIHFALRRGHTWARTAVLASALIPLGLNAYGMYQVGSPWQYPAIQIALFGLGAALYRSSFAFAPQGPVRPIL